MIGLAIDTSTNVMGVAIVNQDTVIAELITNEKKNHSVRLMPAIDRLMKKVDVIPKQLNRIIVAKGPGSYTGVRIGVSVAKTLAWSLHIPLVGISSLEALALNGRYFNGVVSPLFDARRGQLYTSLYRFEHGQIQTIEKERIIVASEWAKQLQTIKEPVLFLGNDLVKHRKMFQEILANEAYFGSPSEHNPRPGELAILGMQRDPVANIHLFTPNYVQLAEAEKNWQQAQKNGDS
ncbi:tRNA (adenosine(37)-N6)-threonylcarbamoyltransferase complex dimerization subunit type 1 TsaB [Pueribacillus sp. YX66]|uniref:tRNA (adenosine(37)-N6)-threonylcarbamoyltransferase complex dimerization subunit type 1 TsaB n=1 Tax=Pueribacillus sp. YX66 TaxID=3229242 RepID=UPI00358D0CCB